uniref:Peptidase S1 domain-containing protein n=1 Tax=Nothobranchius rachovii TaxID=451742 RepID=A0A1A8S4B7_9TELE
MLRCGGRALLPPRAGGGDQDHRGSGGLGPFLALAGLPPVLLHVRLWGGHHRTTVGHLCCSLLHKVRGHCCCHGNRRKGFLRVYVCSDSKLLEIKNETKPGVVQVPELGTGKRSKPIHRYNTVSLWKVLAGKHDLDKPQEPEEQLVDVTRIISHHQYDTRTKESDVALVKLDRPLVFNQFVRPIDLWMTPLPDLMRCTITGWGSTRENGPRINRLQEVNVSILSSVDCNEYYGGRVRASMFCAGKDEGGADACQGDSGGPLSCFTGTRHELAGLVSWGVGCGRANRPGVYTKVQEHVEWISGIMNDENANEEENSDEAENRCGRQRSTCEGVPGVAGISVSPDRVVKVENLTESCPSSWPWMVSLQSSGQHYCSGVLVQHRWVVTAKHCSISAKEDVVVFGLQDLSQRAVQTILVDEVFSPLHDTSFPPQADLALVRLSIPARFGPKVSPICVPEEDEELDQSWTCITAGWGKSKATGNLDPNKQHNAELTLVNETACALKWGDFISDAHICSHPAGSASCMGDSGAPLFCRKRDVYFLFGVVTWGSWRCGADKPAIFTRVPEFHSWMDDVMDDI